MRLSPAPFRDEGSWLTLSWQSWFREIHSLITGLPPIYTGADTPESKVTARVGALYTRTNGGANTTLYVKESGDNTNTGWVAK